MNINDINVGDQVLVSKFRKAMILANKLSQLRPLIETSLTARQWRSDHFRSAYAALSLYGDKIKVIRAVKLDGTTTERLVIENWRALNLIKGNGRPTPSDSTLFVDVAKLINGDRHTVSFKIGRYQIVG